MRMATGTDDDSDVGVALALGLPQHRQLDLAAFVTGHRFEEHAPPQPPAHPALPPLPVPIRSPAKPATKCCAQAAMPSMRQWPSVPR